MKVQIVLLAAVVALSYAYSIPEELSEELEPSKNLFELLDELNDNNETEPKNLASTTEKPLCQSVQMADSVDWRAKGAVTPVKEEGGCNAGWAFAVAGAVEGLLFHNKKDVVSLSAQNLLDCSDVIQGCRGGSIKSAFEYIIHNRGIQTDETYPYIGEQGRCKYNPTQIGAKIEGYNIIKQYDEEDLKSAVSVTPVAAMIDADHSSFRDYKGGIWYEPECSSTHVNHGVLVVGYGTDPHSKVDYWLVKNSWGANWGEKGYMKIIRNKDNHCGIATSAMYPY